MSDERCKDSDRRTDKDRRQLKEHIPKEFDRRADRDRRLSTDGRDQGKQ